MRLRGHLEHNEHLILGVRSHPITLIPAASLLLGAAVAASFASSLKPTAPFIAYLALASALWLVALAVVRIIRWATTAYLLTNLRVIIQTGLVQAQHQSISLEVIEGVKLHSSRLSLGNQADLSLTSLGRKYRLYKVPEASLFSQHIYQAQKAVFMR